MKKRTFILATCLVLILVAALAFDLPGIAIATLGPPAGKNNPQPDQASGVLLTGGSYSLNSTIGSIVDGASSAQAGNALSGGSYQITDGGVTSNRPAAIPGDNGCCCNAKLPCVIK